MAASKGTPQSRSVKQAAVEDARPAEPRHRHKVSQAERAESLRMAAEWVEDVAYQLSLTDWHMVAQRVAGGGGQESVRRLIEELALCAARLVGVLDVHRRLQDRKAGPAAPETMHWGNVNFLRVGKRSSSREA